MAQTIIVIEHPDKQILENVTRETTAWAAECFGWGEGVKWRIHAYHAAPDGSTIAEHLDTGEVHD